MTEGIPRDSDVSIGVDVEGPIVKESPEYSFFDSLPIEVFLHICSFLEVSDMVMTLSRVCKRFHDILSDESIWKCWIARRFCSRYPLIPIEKDGFDWRGACFDIEKEWKLWRSVQEKVYYMKISEVETSTCDAVLLVNSGEVCLSGSRDRGIGLWKPLMLNKRPRQYSYYDSAHNGWIRGLMYFQDTVYSCSWDKTVKSWSIDSDSLKPISTFSCSSPALSMTSLDGLIIVGDYQKTVYGFDPRAKPEPQFTYSVHQCAVLTLGSNETDIISGSEDKTIALWDSRKRSLRERMKISNTSFPNCCSTDNDSIYIGDSRGKVYVYSTRKEEVCPVTNIKMGHKEAISVIKHGRGYLLTGSQDRTIKICLPTRPPKLITTLRSTGGPICGLDYCNGIIAAGTSNCVEFWIPKDLLEDI